VYDKKVLVLYVGLRKVFGTLANTPLLTPYSCVYSLNMNQLFPLCGHGVAAGCPDCFPCLSLCLVPCMAEHGKPVALWLPICSPGAFLSVHPGHDEIPPGCQKKVMFS